MRKLPLLCLPACEPRGSIGREANYRGVLTSAVFRSKPTRDYTTCLGEVEFGPLFPLSSSNRGVVVRPWRATGPFLT